MWVAQGLGTFALVTIGLGYYGRIQIIWTIFGGEGGASAHADTAAASQSVLEAFGASVNLFSGIHLASGSINVGESLVQGLLDLAHQSTLNAEQAPRAEDLLDLISQGASLLDILGDG